MNDLDVHLPAICARDPQAFAQWMVGVEPVIRASLRSFATTVDVEVVVQEALVRAWNFAPRVTVDGRGNSLLRYARRVARNLAIDEVRKRSREQVTDEVPDEGHEVAMPDPALRQWIATCLEALPPRPRAAMGARLAAAGRIHDRDVASTVEMGLNTFLKNVGRARKLLAECLAGRGVEVTP